MFTINGVLSSITPKYSHGFPKNDSVENEIVNEIQIYRRNRKKERILITKRVRQAIDYTNTLKS